MKKSLLFGSSLLIILTVPAQAVSTGLYSVAGTCSHQGDYKGVAQIQDGSVQRIVRYQSVLPSGDELETVWTGKVEDGKIRFSLKVSTTMTFFEGFQATSEMLNNPVRIDMDLEKNATSFHLPQEGDCQESWTRFGEASSAALWTDQRQIEDATGSSDTFILRLAGWLGIDRIIDWYRHHEETKPWAQRPEFLQKRQYQIEDFTDLGFYQENLQVLRITNRWLNAISLAEAQLRRNAFGKTPLQKAEIAGRETEMLNLNEAGVLEYALVDSEGRKTGFIHDHDSALWSAIYGLSLALQYQTTQDPKAYELFKKVLRGTLTLVDIVDAPDQFARTVILSPASEPAPPDFTQGRGRYSHLKWKSRGNNDMIKGILLMFLLADSTLSPQETELRSDVARLAPKLLTLEPAQGSFNGGIAQAINAIWSGDHRHFDKFKSSVFNIEETLAKWFHADEAFYLGGIYDFSGVHLTCFSNILQILAAREVQRKFTQSRDLEIAREIQFNGEDRLFRIWKVMEKAHLKYLTVLTAAFSSKAMQDSEFRRRLQYDLSLFHEVPYPRNIGTAASQVELRPEWSLSAWPKQPWKGLSGPGRVKSDLQFSRFKHGAYSYPIFEGLAFSNYMWKDAQAYPSMSVQGNFRSFDADYLLIYWLARRANLIH